MKRTPSKGSPIDSQDSLLIANVEPKKRKAIIPIEAITQLADKGLTHAEIAAILKCDRSNITYRLNSIGYESINHVNDYQKYREKILAKKQLELVNALTPTKIETMSGRDLVWSAAVLFDKERLETGKSTSNVSSITTILNDLDARRRKQQPQDIAVEDSSSLHNQSDKDNNE